VTKQHAEVAARLYALYDAAHALWSAPADYERATKPMWDLVVARMAKYPEESELAAFNAIGQKLMEDGRDALLIPLGAALVDWIEGRA